MSGQVDQLADPSQAAGLKANLEIPATEYLKAMRIRTLLKQKFRELFAQVDVLVAPSRYDFAPKITEPLDGPDPVPSPRSGNAGHEGSDPGRKSCRNTGAFSAVRIRQRDAGGAATCGAGFHAKTR